MWWCNTAVSHIYLWFCTMYFSDSISRILYHIFLWFYTMYFSESVDRTGWSVLDAVRWCKTAVGRLSTQLLISAVHQLQHLQPVKKTKNIFNQRKQLFLWGQPCQGLFGDNFYPICVKHAKNYSQNIARTATQCNHCNALQKSKSSSFKDDDIWDLEKGEKYSYLFHFD